LRDDCANEPGGFAQWTRIRSAFTPNASTGDKDQVIGRLFIASGLLALAVIAGVFFFVASPDKTAPAALAETPVLADKAADAPAAKPADVPAPQAKPAVSPADEPFVIKRILPIKGPIKYGEWHWDDSNVPTGPIVITVDLDARVLSVFRNGYEIGATAVLLGTEDKPTPLGVFPITQKDRDHVSNIYTGAPMPYMQRLTDDGITLHGSKVELGYASHGCIGMPEAFAAKLFDTTHLGDKVYITRGKQVGMGDSLVGA
jgi:lipoprotein-anchoring transpeptidase ErfK/SrfK